MMEVKQSASLAGLIIAQQIRQARSYCLAVITLV